MTVKEITAFAIISVIALILLLVVWPFPRQVDKRQQDMDLLNELLQKRQEEQKQPIRKRPPQKHSILQEMEEAAAELVRQFGPAKDSILKKAQAGKLEKAQPHEGELPAPGKTAQVYMLLVLGDIPTCDRKKGRVRLRIAGLDKLSFDNAEKTGPDFELLASVLTALNARRQTAAGEGLAVEIIAVPFTPLEAIEKVVEAAARAGIHDIQFKYPPIPY